MRKKTAVSPAFHAGSSLLLVIFIVLCLVVLATLSLSGVLRDRTYAQKEAQKTTAFYEADTTAVRVLENIDQSFLSLCQGGSADRDAVIEQLSGIDYPENTAVTFSESNCSDTTIEADYIIRINERQSLSVCILLDMNQDIGHGGYEILSWQEVPTGSWEGNDSLPVLQTGE